MKIDIIILSNCINDKIFRMNQECLTSLEESESNFDFSVKLIESNKQFSKEYKTNLELEIIIPQEDFNYNRFLNIGLDKCSSEFIAFCNNDIIFYENWFSEIKKIADRNSDIHSFSPINKESKFSAKYHNSNKDFIIGYNIREHFVGWCYVFDRFTINKIERFDEKFSFYFQDDDLGLTLRKLNIKHALVTKAEVYHLGGESSSITDGFSYNQRINADSKIFHDKWGSQRNIAMKNRLMFILRKIGLSELSKVLY